MARSKTPDPAMPLDTPATPGKRAIKRVDGAEEEILEGYGLTRLGEVIYLSTAFAELVLSQGGKYAPAHTSTQE